jgi:hypothetical protein
LSPQQIPLNHRLRKQDKHNQLSKRNPKINNRLLLGAQQIPPNLRLREKDDSTFRPVNLKSGKILSIINHNPQTSRLLLGPSANTSQPSPKETRQAKSPQPAQSQQNTQPNQPQSQNQQATSMFPSFALFNLTEEEMRPISSALLSFDTLDFNSNISLQEQLNQEYQERGSRLQHLIQCVQNDRQRIDLEKQKQELDHNKKALDNFLKISSKPLSAIFSQELTLVSVAISYFQLKVFSQDSLDKAYQEKKSTSGQSDKLNCYKGLMDRFISFFDTLNSPANPLLLYPLVYSSVIHLIREDLKAIMEKQIRQALKYFDISDTTPSQTALNDALVAKKRLLENQQLDDKQLDLYRDLLQLDLDIRETEKVKQILPEAFELFELTEGSITLEKVKQKHKQLAKRYHSDKAKEQTPERMQEADAMMSKVTQCYSALTWYAQNLPNTSNNNQNYRG